MRNSKGQFVKGFIAYSDVLKKNHENSKGRKLTEDQKQKKRDYKHTPEALRKISISSKNRIRKKETYIKAVETRRRNNSYNHTMQSRQQMSDKRKGVPKSFGFRENLRNFYKKNPKKINKTFNDTYEQTRKCFEYRQWVSDIFHRDNFTCQDCGDNTGGNLEAHHIKAFIIILKQYNIETFEQALHCAELWDINNGRTLCKNCHKKTKNYGSRAR